MRCRPGPPGEDRLAKYIADNLPPAIFGDFAPRRPGIIDEDTWYEQAVDLNQAATTSRSSVRARRRCSPTPTSCWPAPTRPTRSATRSSACSPRPPRTAANPFFDRVAGRARATTGSGRDRYIRGAYHSGPTPGSALARHAGAPGTPTSSPATTGSRRSGRRSTPRWSLKQLGLQDVEQTGNCPAATPPPEHHHGQGLLGRRDRADLPQPQRPRPPGLVPRPTTQVRDRIVAGLPGPEGPEAPGRRWSTRCSPRRS